MLKEATNNKDSFVRLPKALFSGEYSLSHTAKVLYAFLLDRLYASPHNKENDANCKPFITFTIEEAMVLLGCSKGTAIKAFAELDGKSGSGLIERKKRGRGNPDIIYVYEIFYE